jgi:4'-phosphopantetheinyl transferase
MRVVLRVDLVLLEPASLPGDGADWLSLLDAGERTRHGQLRQAADRLAYVAAHGLLRQALSRWEPSIEPAAWRFERGPHGKPLLPGAGPSFNLSHCRQLVAVAITARAPLGVDVEPVDARLATDDVARRVYGSRELADLASHPRRVERFFERWTLKEAWVKATGVGISDDLPAFEVRLEPGRGFVARGDGRPWQLHWWTPRADVKLGLCVESDEALDVTPTTWTP